MNPIKNKAPYTKKAVTEINDSVLTGTTQKLIFIEGKDNTTISRLENGKIAIVHKDAPMPNINEEWNCRIEREFSNKVFVTPLEFCRGAEETEEERQCKAEQLEAKYNRNK